MKIFKDVTYQGRDIPSSPSLSTFFISRHITYLLCYVNEGTACDLECAIFCERQKEKDPITTKNLDQRTFYYKTCSFLKTVNMMNFSLNWIYEDRWFSLWLFKLSLPCGLMQSCKPTQKHLLPSLMTGYNVFHLTEWDSGKWHRVST